MLGEYVEDAEERDLSSMDDDVWDAYLSTKKKDYEDKIAAENKAEKEAEEVRRVEKLRCERANKIKPYYNFYTEDGVNIGELDEEQFLEILNDLKSKKEVAQDIVNEIVNKINV